MYKKDRTNKRAVSKKGTKRSAKSAKSNKRSAKSNLNKSLKNKPLCFPGDAKVTMESGEIKNISEIRVGDRVQIATGDVAEVIFVPHQYNDDTYSFIRLTTETGKQIMMTEDHNIPILPVASVTSEQTDRMVVTQCKKVVIGDRVQLQDGSWDAVADILTNVEAAGAYSFVTDREFIVVDGIVASPFGFDLFSHEVFHTLFHALRWTYKLAPAFNAHPLVAKTILFTEERLAILVR